ncbi:MAG: nitroreductase family protein, partial [Sphingobacterium sp.]
MNMQNDVLKTIHFRRSVFQANFTDKEVSKEDLYTILQSANAAPTHKRTQPWRFVIFRKDGLKRLGKELGSIYKTITPEDKYNPAVEENMEKKATMSNAAIAIIVNYS